MRCHTAGLFSAASMVLLHLLEEKTIGVSLSYKQWRIMIGICKAVSYSCELYHY